jgi:hypothetical protein
MQNKEGSSTERYYPVNRHKFVGKTGYAVCRSSYEVAFCKWADSTPSVKRWSSEDVRIQYQDPLVLFDNKNRPKLRTYYPDFVIETDKGEVFLIEVKPKKQTIPPTITENKSRKTIMTEKKTWTVNQAKWRAAQNYCNRMGWVFKIITEDQLFRRR